MRIGLTGGIASGKSTVAARLHELGAYVIDYDMLAAAVVAPGSEGLRRIVGEFGDRAVREDGTLNRPWMAEHVFGAAADRDASRRLDAIEHPLIYARAARMERDFLRAAPRGTCPSSDMPAPSGTCISSETRAPSGPSAPSETRAPSDTHARGRRVIVHDVPLLTEVGDAIPFSFDHIVTVEAPEAVRIERMMRTRGMSREQAEDRVRHQANREERLRRADIVIDATQPIERMFETVDTLYRQWTAQP